MPTAEDWAGRFWGRTGCNDDNNRCVTGDCGDKLECNGAGGAPPASLAEFKFKGSDGQDFYDISFVDGFNLQIAVRNLINRFSSVVIVLRSKLSPMLISDYTHQPSYYQ